MKQRDSHGRGPAMEAAPPGHGTASERPCRRGAGDAAPGGGPASRTAWSAPGHRAQRTGCSPSPARRGPSSRAPGPIPAPRADAPAHSGRHAQLLVEPGLAARLEVADDDAELPDVLHELLQVLLQVVELLRHGPAPSTATAAAPLRRFRLPPGPTVSSVSSEGRGRGWRRGRVPDPGAPPGAGPGRGAGRAGRGLGAERGEQPEAVQVSGPAKNESSGLPSVL